MLARHVRVCTCRKERALSNHAFNNFLNIALGLLKMLSSFLAGCRSAIRSVYHSYFSLPNLPHYADVCARMGRVQAMALDLGCGRTPKNPFGARELFGVDLDYGVDASKNILACDLGMEPLPFPSDHFDFVSAFDLIEHIPRLVYKGDERHAPFIQLMNEVHRVLKSGGIFLSHTPAYPRMAAFTDPTHTNIISVMTFRLYFCTPHLWASRYGFIGSFELRKQGWDVDNLVTIMEKS